VVPECVRSLALLTTVAQTMERAELPLHGRMPAARAARHPFVPNYLNPSGRPQIAAMNAAHMTDVVSSQWSRCEHRYLSRAGQDQLRQSVL